LPASRNFHLRLVPVPPRDAAEASTRPEWDDRALLAGLEARDRAASAAFYDRARPIIDRTLARLLGVRDPEYEDLAQIALYELVDTISRFRDECPLDAWLSLITARVVYREIRRRRLQRRIFTDAPQDELTGGLISVPAPFAQRQAVARIREHLAAMDERRAWTFMLHDVHGYELKQIAAIMQASPSAAQSRLVRARRELHERIRNDPALAGVLDDLSEETP
jgi:RNA polymerase sigma-70 factor, ECF subfamily